MYSSLNEGKLSLLTRQSSPASPVLFDPSVKITGTEQVLPQESGPEDTSSETSLSLEWWICL